METKKIIAQYAFKIYSGIALYFLIMKLLGLEHILVLRMLNFVIVIWGINAAIKTNIFKNDDTDYLSNTLIGVSTSIIAVFASSLSLYVYLTFISPEFIHQLESSLLWGNNLNALLIAFVVFFEGTASSVVSTFIIMQYWKNYKVLA
jgi:hypothetical protein